MKKEAVSESDLIPMLEALQKNLELVDFKLDIGTNRNGQRFLEWYNHQRWYQQLWYNFSHVSHKEQFALLTLLLGLAPTLAFLYSQPFEDNLSFQNNFNYGLFCLMVVLTALELGASIADRKKAKNPHIGLLAPEAIKWLQTFGMAAIVLCFGLESYAHFSGHNDIGLSLSMGVDSFLGLLAITVAYHLLTTLYHGYRVLLCDQTDEERGQNLPAALLNLITVVAVTMMGIGFGAIAGADGVADFFGMGAKESLLVALGGISILLGQIIYRLKGAHLQTNELVLFGREEKTEENEKQENLETQCLVSGSTYSSERDDSFLGKSRLSNGGFLATLSAPRKITESRSITVQRLSTLTMLREQLEVRQLESKVLDALADLIADPAMYINYLENPFQLKDFIGTYTDLKGNVEQGLSAVNTSYFQTSGSSQNAVAAAVTCIAGMQGALKLELSRKNKPTLDKSELQKIFPKMEYVILGDKWQLVETGENHLSPFQIVSLGK